MEPKIDGLIFVSEVIKEYPIANAYPEAKAIGRQVSCLPKGNANQFVKPIKHAHERLTR
jgi:hypothetical protein